jgi:UDPglucose 6-dehydrogenase
MKIGVLGLWHLGVVMSASLAEVGFTIVAFDDNEEIINKLELGILPVEEPGINDLLAKAIRNNKITFTCNRNDLKDCEVIWITYDTPVHEDDSADTEYVMTEIKTVLPYVENNAVMVISSQLPVGSTKIIRKLIDNYIPGNNISLAVSPENLRLGKSLDSFFKAERFVVGVEGGIQPKKITELFNSLNDNILWMNFESAEMVKHSLNAYLATCVTFMAEISEICENVGANARDVEIGLRTDQRVGIKSYLSPGLGFAGGTLARDIKYLNQVFKRNNENTILGSLIPSNDYNNNWVLRKIHERYSNLSQIPVIFMGLTYTSGTNTLRRSAMIELALYLSNLGSIVSYFDDDLKGLEDNFQNKITQVDNPSQNLAQNSIVVISKKMIWMNDDIIIKQIFDNSSMVLDPNGFLFNNKDSIINKTKYFSVGSKNV